MAAHKHFRYICLIFAVLLLRQFSVPKTSGSCFSQSTLVRSVSFPCTALPGRKSAVSCGKSFARRASSFDYAEEGVRVRAIVSYDFDDDASLDLESIDLNSALDFVCGEGDVAAGLDEGVRGMTVGETRELRFGVDSPLFGFRDEAKVIEVPRADLPQGCAVGEVVRIREDGDMGAVQRLGELSASVDLNHPLAGRAVSARITLLRCEEAAQRKVQVRTIAAGDGMTYARFGDSVTLHLVVTNMKSGSIVESSRESRTPRTIRVGLDDLQPSWEEGISQVSLGGRAEIQVPGNTLSPAGLMLDVEIISIHSELELAL